jgi:hypothetical protein
MTTKNTNHKRPQLKVVQRAAPSARVTTEAHRPEGVPAGAKLWAVDVTSDYRELGVYEGDLLVTWVDGPLRNYDLATVEARGEMHIGRYHSAPGGYVRLEGGDEGEEYEEVYHVFRPSDIQAAARVMHIERRGKIVRKFPPAKGGAR